MKGLYRYLMILALCASMAPQAHATNRTGGSFQDLFKSPTPVKQSTNLGPFAIGYEFCQKIQSIAPILQAYSNVMWPVLGFPGFTMGIVQNESVILKICDFLVKLETLSTEGAIFASARFLNELTGKKWNDHLTQADLTWNIANSIYDFRGQGGFRKGALASASTHRRLVSFADKTAKWYQKSFEGEENPEGIEDQSERKRKLDKAAQLAYQRAILKEATDCPIPTGNKDLQKEYGKKVIPEQERRNDSRREADQLRRQMIKMGKDFINQVNDLERYTSSIDQLIEGGYAYKKTDSSVTVDRIVPSQDQTNSDGTPKEITTKEKRLYQKVSISRNTDMWNDFRNDYVEKWETWVNSQMLSTGTFGLLDGKKGRIEEKYKNYSYECSESRLRARLRVKDRSDPSYNKELREEQAKCRDNLKVRKANFENLLDEYVRRLDQEVRTFKGATAKIWTFESFYLGTKPISEDLSGSQAQKVSEQNIKSIQRPEESCKPQFTPAEMAKLSLDLDNVNMEINQQIMEASVQDQMMDEARLKAQVQENKDVNETINQSIQKGRESGFSQKRVQPIVSPNSGL